jgi:uncharacterized protein (DUF305 family)
VRRPATAGPLIDTTSKETMLKKTILGTAVSITAAAIVLTACGSGGESGGMGGMSMTNTAAPSSNASAHNAADIAFAQEMIMHHQQALSMAALAAQRASATQVKDLAGRIEKAQQPEIQQMTGWLAQWGVTSGSSMPSMPSMPSMTGMTGGSMPSATNGSMPGMMSDSDMRKLQEATGTAFDKMFLQMMTDHHQGAVQMANTELATGANPDAKTLAQNIIEAQTAEIDEMRQLLAAM